MARANLQIRFGVCSASLFSWLHPLSCSKCCAFRPGTPWPPNWSSGFSWSSHLVEIIFPRSPGWPLLKSSPAPHHFSSPTPIPCLVSVVNRGVSIALNVLKVWRDTPGWKRREDEKWQCTLYLFIFQVYSHPLGSYSNHWSPTAS